MEKPKRPFELRVKINITDFPLAEKFQNKEVQTIISDRLHTAADAILRAMGLEEHYEVMDLSRAGAMSTSFKSIHEKEGLMIEAILLAVEKKREEAEK